MHLLLLSLALAGDELPTWSDLVPAWQNATAQARLAPDGTGLLWVEGGEVHVAPPTDTDARQSLDVPEEAQVHAWWLTPNIADVRIYGPDGLTRHFWRDGAWHEGKVPDDAARGYPAAPRVTLRRAQDKRSIRRVDTASGDTTGTWPLGGKRSSVLADETGTPRARTTWRRGRIRYHTLDGGGKVQAPDFFPQPDPSGGPLKRRVGSRPLGLVGSDLWALDGRGRDYVALQRYDLHTGEGTVAFAVPGADLIHASIHPDTGVPDLVRAYEALPRWYAVDPGLEADLARITDALPGPMRHIERARGDRIWHACGGAPHTEQRCVLFDRDAGTTTTTLTADLVTWPHDLPRTVAVQVPTSDGLLLDSYLVLPPGHVAERPDEPLPTVLRMHGGPYARAFYGYDPTRALLATRGYAVLDLNYRGSTFMGVDVLTGADGERGRNTQRDVREATHWLVEQGIADPDRIALMGHSYGGYSTLLGLVRDPELYACGVALAPTAAWAYRWVVPFLPRSLKARAPYPQLDAADDPLLLIHGTDDRVLPVGESRHVAKVLQRAGKPVGYLEVEGGGHGLDDDGVRAAIGETVETFLAGCLAGASGPADPEAWPDTAVLKAWDGLGPLPGG